MTGMVRSVSDRIEQHGCAPTQAMLLLRSAASDAKTHKPINRQTQHEPHEAVCGAVRQCTPCSGKEPWGNCMFIIGRKHNQSATKAAAADTASASMPRTCRLTDRPQRDSQAANTTFISS